jgi:uncharacterized protein YqfB (UPF0267 family)
MRQIIFKDKAAIDSDIQNAKIDLKAINSFQTRIGQQLTKDEYYKIVASSGNVNFDALNELCLAREVETLPTLKALSKEISPENLRQFANVDEWTHLYAWNTEDCMAISGLVQTNLLNGSPYLWEMNKAGEAVLAKNAEKQINESYTQYAETELELKRFDICNQIKDLTEQLIKDSSIPENFDASLSVLQMHEGNLIPSVQIVLAGQHTGARPLHFRIDNKPQAPIPNPLRDKINKFHEKVRKDF